MIKLTYASYHTVWVGREQFERIVDRIAEGVLPENATDLTGQINWIRVGDATPDHCPLKKFWRVVKTGDAEAIAKAKAQLLESSREAEDTSDPREPPPAMPLPPPLVLETVRLPPAVKALLFIVGLLLGGMIFGYLIWEIVPKLKP